MGASSSPRLIVLLHGCARERAREAGGSHRCLPEMNRTDPFTTRLLAFAARRCRLRRGVCVRLPHAARRPAAREDEPFDDGVHGVRAREARARRDASRGTCSGGSAIDRISPNLTRAVLVAEDAAFWEHDGVDYDELQKSIELDWARGQLVRGASTITQQLAKNLYLSPSKNPLRKFRELIIARRLEAELNKTRILELYLNVIEWGDGIYGIEAAAQAYFGTRPPCSHRRGGAAGRSDRQSAPAESRQADASAAAPAADHSAPHERNACNFARLGSSALNISPPSTKFLTVYLTVFDSAELDGASSRSLTLHASL